MSFLVTEPVLVSLASFFQGNPKILVP